MRLVLTAVLAMAISGSVLGQERPNFSGRWVPLTQPDGSGQLVTHDATTLSTLHGSEGADHGATYKLDGSENRNVIPSHGSQIVSVSKAEWVGSTLRITEISTYPDGREMQSTRLWWLDAQGRLIVEFTATITGQQPMSGVSISRRVN
jgi:hypothetical protein